MTILLRDLPDVGSLEWEVEQHGWTDDNVELAFELSVKLFGIDQDDTFLADDAPESETIAWEKHFAVLTMYRDESDAFWASHGWDVTDGNARELAVMDYLVRPLVCVVSKLHPDAKFTISDEQWATNLEEEARRWRPDPAG